MIRFKDMSINWKVGSLFLLLLGLTSLDLIFFFVGKQEQLDILSQVAERNKLLTQQIALYSEAFSKATPGASDKLNQAIDEHESLLQVIKEGGNPVFLGGSKHVRGVYNKLPAHVDEALSFWKEYKQNALNVTSADSAVSSQAINYIYQNADKMLAVDEDLLSDISNLNRKMDNFSSNLYLFIILTIFLLIPVSIFIINKFVSVPVRNILPVFMDMSNGILGEKIQQVANDEIGSLTGSFNRMNDNLARIMKDITMGAENIVQGSAQISDASQMLSQGASEQAASAEEVSAAIEQMSANIQQNAENAKLGDMVFSKAGVRMHEMAASSKETLDAIRNITDKIAIINDIAYQTNILALNAAVEASRAGEHGRGFAVVASEVRTLAERSKSAADQIISLSRSTLKTTENTEKLAEELASEFEKSSRMIKEIAASSDELTTGAEQINTAVQQMNQVTQQNAAASEELATSAEEFSSQAEQLKEVVGFFTFDTSGRKDSRGTAKLIEWSSKYHIGIKEIDDQHRILVDIINKLYASFGSSNNKKEIKKNLKELVDYTVFHFGNEENYFKSFGYKDTPAHLEQHKMFVDKIKNFANEFEDGDSTVSLDIINFLKDWLINHILKIDVRYVPFLKEHGVK
jgi:methyl-accepting chemotaxis protein